jgi:hypothetical protein
MHFFAGYLNQLNRKGKVKRFSINEKGYAKVVDIRPGCSIWLHHVDYSLYVSLRISQTAQKRYPAVCVEAAKRFQKFFDNKTVVDTWRHGLNPRTLERHHIEITTWTDSAILKTIDRLKESFHFLSDGGPNGHSNQS